MRKIIMLINVVIVAVVMNLFVTACGSEPYEPYPPYEPIEVYEPYEHQEESETYEDYIAVYSDNADDTAKDNAIEWKSVTFIGWRYGSGEVRMTFDIPAHWEIGSVHEYPRTEILEFTPPSDDLGDIHRGRLGIQIIDFSVFFDYYTEIDDGKWIEVNENLAWRVARDIVRAYTIEHDHNVAGYEAVYATMSFHPNDPGILKGQEYNIVNFDIANRVKHLYQFAITITENSPDYMIEVFERAIDTLTFNAEIESEKVIGRMPVFRLELGSDWRDFFREFNEWIDEHFELLERLEQNPTAPDLLEAYEANLQRVPEWEQRVSVLHWVLPDADMAEFESELEDSFQRLYDTAIEFEFRPHARP